MKIIKFFNIVFFAVAILIFSSCNSDNQKQEKDSDGIAVEDTDNEIPDIDEDTVVAKVSVSGVVCGEDLINAAEVSLVEGETVLATAVSDSSGVYSLNAGLNEGTVYCVDAVKNDLDLSVCFKYVGLSETVVNINPVTTLPAMLYKNKKYNFADSEVTARIYFKIGSGINLYDLDYAVYPLVAEGFKSVTNALHLNSLNEAMNSVYKDITTTTDLLFNFSYLFNGFVITADSLEIILEDDKSSQVALHIETSSEEIASGFDIRWFIPEGKEREGVHAVETEAEFPGEIPVITKLIYKDNEGEVLTLASKTTVITVLKVTSSTDVTVESSSTMVHKKINDSVFFSFPAGMSITKDGQPVNKITFKEISSLSGTTISRFILEPAGAVFADGTPLYVTLNLDNLFSGNPSALFTERVSGDGEKAVMTSSSGDPIMLATSGDPIMSKVFSGDPIMQGDSIVDEGMSRALTFSTNHFSRFNNDTSVLKFSTIMMAWNSNPELQIIDEDNNSLSPWGFIVSALEKSSYTDAAIIAEIFKDTGKIEDLSERIAPVFERKTGTVDNYTILENYYWTWRFLVDLEKKMGKLESIDSKIFPSNAMCLKEMMNYLYTGATVSQRSLTVSDVFKENIDFSLNETVSRDNTLPGVYKNSRRVFMGIPVTQTPDTATILNNSLANTVFMPFNKMLSNVNSPVIHSTPDKPLSFSSLFCIWTSIDDSLATYSNCLSSPVNYSLNTSEFVAKPDGTEVSFGEAYNMLKYRFPDIEKVSNTQKKNILKALYIFLKYGSEALSTPNYIELFKSNIYDSVALLLLELRNAIDTVTVSEQSSVSDSMVFVNNKAETDLRNFPSVSTFDRFMEKIKISADTASLSDYTFSKAILNTARYEVSKVKKDAENKPVLVYETTKKDASYLSENIPVSAFTSSGSRSNVSVFELFENVDLSEFEKSYVEAELTIVYSFKGRDYIQKRNYTFSVYPKDELDVITVDPSTVESSVLYSGTQSAIADATVILRPGNVISKSDETGKFVFANLAAGYYEIEVFKEGYLPATANFMVAAGEYKVIPPIYTALEPVEIFKTSVTGSVVNFYTATLVSDVRIILKKGSGEVLLNQIYSNGTFTMEDIETGNYSVTASKTGFYSASAQFTVQDTPVTLSLIRLAPAQYCENGVAEIGEVCDGNVRECSAISETYASGLAVCRSDCSGFDLSGCVQRSLCGNSVVEAGEFCDKNTKSCNAVSSQYASGTAACSDDCLSWNLSACQGAVTEPVCGDSKIESPEVCDGNSKTCVVINSELYASGTAQCKNDCKGFNEDTCVENVTERVTNCTNQLPANAFWKVAYAGGELAQTWTGINWTPSSDSCEWECNTNYTFNSVDKSCVADTRIYSCPAKPANTVWNTVDNYEQTWSGTEWLPVESSTDHNVIADTQSCRFKCSDNYSWSGTECVADTKLTSCSGLLTNASWNTASEITQTWNGTEWLPSTEGTYNEIADTQSCRYKCKNNYTWSGTECVADTKLTSCSGLSANASWNTASEITQTWNGTEWLPLTEGTYNEELSTSECRYKCDDNYTWSGTECVADTIYDQACTGLPSNSEWNTVSSITQNWSGSAWSPTTAGTYNTSSSTSECRFRCLTHYTWNSGSSSCVADTRTFSCYAKPVNTTWNTVSSYEQTWSGSEWVPVDSTTEYNETADTQSCRYKCSDNYTWNGSTCIADTKTYNCPAKPDNTAWNTVDNYEQTWSGIEWLPADTVSEYNEIATSDECRYICDTSSGYVRDVSISKCRKCGDGTKEGTEACDDGANNGLYGYCNSDCSDMGPRCGDGALQSEDGEVCEPGDLTTCELAGAIGGVETDIQCSADCSGWVTAEKCNKVWSCNAKPQTNDSVETAFNAVSSFNQQWNGMEWLPADDEITEYNETSSFTSCQFKCGAYFTWDGTACVGETQTYNCPAKPATGTEWNSATSYDQTWTWSGSSYEFIPVGDPDTDYDLTYDEQSCRFKCADNYTWSGTECVADGRTATCPAKPATGTEWNDGDKNGTYTQTWNGSTWIPVNSTIYNTTSGDCRYICSGSYHWDGSACIFNTRTDQACSAKPSNTVYNTVSSITQTWNGSTWLPTTAGTYNEIPSTTQCRYKCSLTYHWDGSTCIADTKTYNCPAKPDNTTWNTVNSYEQTWSGSIWIPAETVTEYNEIAASDECRYVCDASSGYVRDETISKCRKCGDGTKEGTEECDDGNTIDDGNGCSADCNNNSSCGNNIHESIFENCDDGENNGIIGFCNSECTEILVVTGELDENRPKTERKFSGWACDVTGVNDSVKIFFEIMYSKDPGNDPNNLDSVLNVSNYSTYNGQAISLSHFGWEYEVTDLFPNLGSLKEFKINSNCGNTAQTTPHSYEVDFNDTANSIVQNMRAAIASSGDYLPPYYVTAWAEELGIEGKKKTLVNQEEVFVVNDLCGDNHVTGTEVCDDGNIDTEDCAYNTTCIVCDSSCQLVEGYSPHCGDTILNIPDENCDCGSGYWEIIAGACGSSELGSKRCPGYGTGIESCTICNEICQEEILTVPYCGDGYTDPSDEACDDGVNDGSYGTCNSDCTLSPYCGDGVTDSGEENCDDGSNNGVYIASPPGNCSSDCSVFGGGGYCGDAIVQPAYEECDNVINNGSYGTCNSDCTFAPHCGDGVTDAGDEACDDGNTTPGDGCDESCNIETFISISAGDNHTCGVKSNGELYCWGSNYFSALGDGTSVDKDSPTRIGGDTDWQSISTGVGHTCGIKSSGELYCWGWNYYRQLGDGTTTYKNTPTRIGVDTDWQSISAGNLHTCGLKISGELYCWGSNGDGQLGNGTTTYKSTPTRIGVATDWQSISAGGSFSMLSDSYSHTCGVKSSGELYCWGSNGDGQLGDGTITDKYIPTPIGVDTDWQSISIARTHTYGVKTTGELYHWGSGSSSPTRIGVDTDWQSISAGDYHTCGVKSGGKLYCWGSNGDGQLGDGTTANKTSPTQIGVDSDWQGISAGGSHTCGLKISGELYCWGSNGSGKLGVGTTANKNSPTRIGATTDWQSISAGSYHTCGVKSSGELYCWGRNEYYGNLGDGTTANKNSPTRIGVATDWQSISAGGGHTCGIKDNGELYCWGRNYFGELGDGTGGDLTYDNDKSSPTRIGVATDWQSISAGGAHTCGIKDSGELYCWGDNVSGELGDGTAVDKNSPTHIGVATTWQSISAGGSHTCGVKSSGELYCWGSNNSGELGDGTIVDKNSPTQIGAATDWQNVSAGTSHTCGLKISGELYCWGRNIYGELGDGTIVDKNSPTQTGVAADWQSISAGRSYTCGLKSSGELYCWGNNANGELGDGTAWKTTPQYVTFP